MIDPFDIHICPLNIFENQIAQVKLHNLSKSFKPNLANIRILSMETKFILKWKKGKTKNTFRNFESFRIKLNNTIYFKETYPGIFERDKKCKLKLSHTAFKECNAVNEFCFRVR